MYTTKNCVLKYQDIDSDAGVVKGYFAAFGNKDADGDIFTPGAFTKSIQERGPQSTGNRKIAHLRDHKTSQPIALIKELYEDEKGLAYVSQFSKTQYAQDTLTLIKEGILREHSVGFIPVQGKTVNKGDYNEIKEVMLFEGSTLMFGANDQTPVIAKGLSLEEENEVLSEIDVYTKMLRKGNMADDTYQLLEIKLHQLKSIIHSYQKKHSAEPPQEPNVNLLELYKSV